MTLTHFYYTSEALTSILRRINQIKSLLNFIFQLLIRMNYLEIGPSVLHLQGITRSSSFQISNRNDFLAVSFSIVPMEDAITNLKIFPSNGILLGGQQQKIKVKLNNDNASFEGRMETNYRIVVRFSYKAQYNRRYLDKNNMKGWQQLADQAYQKDVHVISGGEKQAIQHYIKQQILFEKTFGTGELNLSAIRQKQEEQAQNESFLNLNIQSRIFDASATELKKENKRLNKSIEVDQIFPLMFGQSRVKRGSKLQTKISSDNQSKNKALIQSKIINEDLSKTFEIQMKTAKNNFMLEKSCFTNSNQCRSSNRALDLIVLAIISAFFVALGNNIKRVIS